MQETQQQQPTTLQRLLLDAGLSLSGFSRASNVDYKTAKRAVSGQRVQPLKAQAMLRVLSQALGRQLSEDDIPEWNHVS